MARFRFKRAGFKRAGFKREGVTRRSFFDSIIYAAHIGVCHVTEGEARMGFSVIVFCGAGLLTSLWLGGFIVYVSTTVGWGSVLFLSPTDAVSLVLGAAPVFILWGLVVLVHIALARLAMMCCSQRFRSICAV